MGKITKTNQMKNLILALLAANTSALNMGREPHIEINISGMDDMNDMNGDNIEINIDMDDCNDEATAGDAAIAPTYDDFDDVEEEPYDSPFADYDSQMAVSEQIYATEI